MIEVELDIYSGRENPRWTLSRAEERELVERVRADPASALRASTVQSRLGYRGMVVTARGDAGERLWNAGLPPQFRLRDLSAGVEKSAADIAERFLLETERSDVVGDAAREAARVEIAPPATNMGGGLSPTVTAAACTVWWTGYSDLIAFWNTNSTRRLNNNCYNFASSLATNTFAQPGRGSGSIFTALTVSNIKAAAFRDGYTSTCNGDRFVDYLVIWPGNDFHWYHRSTDVGGSQRWMHKPGSTPATNLDNSGRIITNPTTCNRGNYTVSGTPYVYAPVSPRANIR